MPWPWWGQHRVWPFRALQIDGVSGKQGAQPCPVSSFREAQPAQFTSLSLRFLISKRKGFELQEICNLSLLKSNEVPPQEHLHHSALRYANHGERVVMGVEGVLLALAPRRERIGDNGVPGRVGAGSAAAGPGCPLGPGSAPEARRWAHGVLGEDGVRQFGDGGPGLRAPPLRAGGWGLESELTPWEPFRCTLGFSDSGAQRTGPNGPLLCSRRLLPISWISDQNLNKQSDWLITVCFVALVGWSFSSLSGPSTLQQVICCV